MKIITIKEKLENKSSSIFIGSELLEKIETIQNLNGFSNVFIVTDKNLEPILLKKLITTLHVATSHIVLNPGEITKTIESIEQIWKAMHRAHCDRKTLVINLGGGVIGDMGGFAASTYMRGVSFLNIPTTLLAQVDASIGGKTGIDFDGIKNLIGTFNQPIAVVVDPQTLISLPKREFVSGFGEIIKHGLITDKKHFLAATAKQPMLFSQIELQNIITRSIEIKANVVTRDKTENGFRKILNFGHTIGHAIEALSLETPHPLLHGEAVSIGMIAEAKISQILGLLSESDFLKIHIALSNSGLPTSISGIAINSILEKIISDKKNNGKKTNFTLLQKIGRAIINQNVSQEIIIEALRQVTK